MHYGANGGALQVMKWLAECGLDPNKDDKGGRRPIHEACLEGKMDVVKWLIEERNIDPTSPNKALRTTLVSEEKKTIYFGVFLFFFNI